MDNENLEMVKKTAFGFDSATFKTTILPTIGGFFIGTLAGVAVCEFVIKPIYKKVNANKVDKKDEESKAE